MRVLVTGGFGYLGGRLAQFLAGKSDVEILLGSRRQREPPHWLPQAKAVQTQWDSIDNLQAVCSGVEVIVHLAGMNAQACAADPVAALDFNGVATARLLRAAVRSGVRRFVYLSTAHVYGSPLSGVVTEERFPLPIDPYATSHRAGEDVVWTAHQTGEIEGSVIRLSNGYGAPAHKDADCWMLLVNDVCRQAVTSRCVALRSTGLQRRDFVPLTEVCLAIDHLHRLPVQSLNSIIFNVGGEWSPTIWEVACFVRDRCNLVLGFEPKLARIQPQVDETVVEFDYRLDALCRTGFRPGSDKIAEIDRLLEFCRASFL